MELKCAKILYKITSEKLQKYEQKSVYFTKPRLVAYFDFNHGRITAAKRIYYFKEPRPDEYPLDLNGDLRKFAPLATKFSHNMDAVLTYDMSAAESNSAENIEQTKIFTRRGTLVHLMESFYIKPQRDEISIRVSRYNNSLYIVREQDDSLTEKKLVHTHHSQFEKIAFTESPNGIPRINEACDENIFQVGVHRSNFGKYDVIYSGEIQGIIDNEKITNFDNLDSLTERRFVATKQMWKSLVNKETKYLKIFLQCYLANIRDIYIGYKNSAGLVEEPIQHTLTKDLRKNRSWKPEICTGTLYDLLENVEKLMSSINCLNTVYVFKYNPSTKFFTYEVFKGKTDKSFISEQYIQFCKKQSHA